MATRASRRAAVTAALAAAVLAALVAATVPAAASDPTSSPSASTKATSTTKAKATPTPTSAAAKAKLKAKAAKARAAADAKVAAAKAAQDETDAHDAAALVAASKALAQAKADLVVAQSALQGAQAELTAAKAADQEAQTELDASVLAEQRATRDLAAVESRIGVSQQDLGRLARSAYQSSGSMGEWAIVLSSTTPNQLADRLSFLQSVGSAGNAMLSRLEQDRADLVNAQASLSAARRRQEDAKVAAAAAVAAVQAKTAMAQSAAQQVTLQVQARQDAFDNAKNAALKDKAQYEQMTVESGALGARIVALAAKLAKGPHPPQGTGTLVRPGLGVVTSPFGPRFHPILHYVKVHTGIDFAAADGIVYAADDGVVLFTEYNVAYGNMTVIDHGTVGGLKMTTLYAHQAVIGVKPGDHVVKGQAIGVIGSTGYATGPHLHFEVRINGEPLDPAPFLVHAKLPTSLPTTVPSKIPDHTPTH
jgi:murein DD-endopeptidase MepM/ murein hydrolase activator NlpD